MNKVVRYIYSGLIVLFTAAILIFMIQNIESVSIAFLSAELTIPKSVLVFLVYIFGMLTGGSLAVMLRSWFRSAVKELPYKTNEVTRNHIDL